MAARRTRIEWTIDEALSPRARAVAIALVLLRIAKVETWDQLAEKLTAGGEEAQALRESVNLPIDDLELLDRFERTLRGLRRAVGRGAAIKTTIIECTACQRWGFFAPSSMPKKCQWKLRCNGEVRKIPEAEMIQKAIR